MVWGYWPHLDSFNSYCGRSHMRYFSAEEIRDIMSKTHLFNTAWALGKCPQDVTPEELVAHWLKYHPYQVHRFVVKEVKRE